MLVRTGGAKMPAGDAMPFEILCQCLQTLTLSTVDRHRRKQIMCKLWDTFGKDENDMFILIRLIVPQLDNERPNYGVKERQLARLYVDLLALPETSNDAQVVHHVAQPSCPLSANSVLEDAAPCMCIAAYQ